jgi:uncharacterized RmlC-like cupin family protein
MKPSTGQYWLALPTLLLMIAAPQLAAAKDTAPSPNMIAGTAIPWVPGVRMKAPGLTPVTAHEQDSILYLLSGKMRLTLGSDSKIIKAGDAVREPSGVPSYWDVLEDSTFVSTSAPIPPNDAH